MADAQSTLSPRLIAGVVLVLVLAGLAFSRYFGSDENFTPPSPSYEALMAEKALGNDGAPPARNLEAAGGAAASRLSGAADSAEEPTGEEEQDIDRKKRKDRKKKAPKESKKDEYGVYRNEDGSVDYKKMPPMGG